MATEKFVHNSREVAVWVCRRRVTLFLQKQPKNNGEKSLTPNVFE